ncbi:phage baseplate assembly protein V [Chryseobacterium sp. H1D6B]|uniref:type VI secretion system Vgr family protein n=1 Tax=Chryseobacterium sp. H1D6B TaxID=2940588 RepID=UPI002473E66D|nr:phage baseplate assembly protein V [Chryseobacterium sp. H1D6B]
MNQTVQPDTPLITEDKIWNKQPVSKIHNAEALPESSIPGLNRIVKLDIIIEGKVISHFTHFKLSQSAVKHHEFSLTLAHDSLGNPENHHLEESQNFLGKRITVVFKYKDIDEGPERNFVGVITEAGFSRKGGNLGNIVLTGYSPGILLDAAPHTQSFGGSQQISLNSIADKVITEGLEKNKFDFRVDAQHGNVSYSSQYEETHYNFLARTAEAYGEQFFYDGEVLHFGKLPIQEQPVKLTYGSSVDDIKIKMKAQHVSPSFYGYNSSKNEKLSAGGSKISHVSDIAQRAYEISEKTFSTPSLRAAPIKASSFMDINASQKGTAGSRASDVFVTSGTTTIPFLYPGCTADIEMRRTDTAETEYFTRLLVTETSHEVDSRGYYTGTFEAVAADSGFIPRPEFHTPKAEPQFAKVISNSDPLNQGRVQVQFDWQSGHDATEFIRVMTPDGGGSDKVSKNRGFMAVPEVGDQVAVNFAYQHPDRPFVMGGMFHGEVGGGGGAGNNVKSLSSRSGNKLELNDGDGSVHLKDQGGADMKFDGAGNAFTNTCSNNTVNAGATNTLNAGSSSIINVGGKDGGGANSVLDMDAAGNIILYGKTSITLQVGTNKIIILQNSININVGNGMLNMTSIDNTLIVSKSNLSLSSDSKTSINAGGEITITGSNVDIN